MEFQQGTSTFAATYLKFDDETYNVQDALGTNNWSLEFFAFLPSSRSTNLSQTKHLLFAVTDEAASSNGGVMLKN